MVFAAGNSPKVGVQAGHSVSVISFAGTAEFPIADEIAVKAEFGAEILKEDYTIGSGPTWKDFSNPGIHLTAFLGPKYCLEPTCFSEGQQTTRSISTVCALGCFCNYSYIWCG